MQNTRNLDRLASAFIDLVGFLNSPRRDEALLREARVRLDRALFPLLVRLDANTSLGVAELAEQVGRDHTTVSRQLAKLESLDLIERCAPQGDRRRHAAQLTAAGRLAVTAITAARRRLLGRALARWSEADLAALADMNRRLADDLAAFARTRA